MSHSYAFQLGRESAISIAEIHAVFRREHLAILTEAVRGSWLHLETGTPLPVAQLIVILGGTIAIAEKIAADKTPEAIADYLEKNQNDGKIVFSMHDCPRSLPIAVKKELKERGRSARFIAPHNTATIIHNHLVEAEGDLRFFGNDIFVTRGVQPIEAWSERDFGRPGRDAKSGMLPPKLARILVNLAELPKTGSILDPFCGSGTVLSEAMLLGYKQLIGSDISDKAITDTEKNLAWIAADSVKPRLIVSPAQTLLTHLSPGSVDAVVTEPYLGLPLSGNDTHAFLERQRQELTSLYLHAFAQFEKILKPGSTVVFIFPAFRERGGWLKTSGIVHELKGHGFATAPFSPDHPTLLYARDDQHVGREIIRFKKT